MKVKSWKTSALGAFTLILAVVSLMLVYFGKATLAEAGGFLGIITGTFTIPLHAFLTKDHDKV